MPELSIHIKLVAHHEQQQNINKCGQESHLDYECQVTLEREVKMENIYLFE